MKKTVKNISVVTLSNGKLVTQKHSSPKLIYFSVVIPTKAPRFPVKTIILSHRETKTQDRQCDDGEGICLYQTEIQNCESCRVN